ncbi:MAG: RdgB/HAM1 family non-canonical purine NTP pyrophosphatase [Ruminococcus sp.]|nr:RdgB/HAM1 family non-canonical purine NTP pyrophosphatase [Ruminococcus sp.]
MIAFANDIYIFPILTIFCTDFIVSWDNFDGEAWFEGEKWKSHKTEKPEKIVLATNNKNKLREVREILEPAGLTVLSQSEAGADIEVEENGKTFAENAYLKAKAVFDLTGLPVIADDSGLEVDALNGAPGVFSARYAQEGQRKKRLLEELENVPDEKRGADFACCICYIDPTGEARYFNGKVFGKIGYESRGTNGFGYDPIFMYGDRSFAEMSAEEKNEVSHRANALKQLKEFFGNV